MVVKVFSLVWLLVAAIGIAIYLSSSNVGLFALGTCGIFVVLLFYANLREKAGRKKYGYYVYKRGGAENGILFYSEHGRELQFYFDRKANTIYIPSDAKWKETMPIWAHDYKQQIVDRVKKCVGKRLLGESWKYEDTSNSKQIVPRDIQGHSLTANPR